MTDAEVKEIVRSKGMCGRIANGQICILERAHHDNAHERGWTVSRRTVCSAYKRDEREANDIVFDVIEGGVDDDHRKTFSTDNQLHANWLASTLTRLEL